MRFFRILALCFLAASILPMQAATAQSQPRMSGIAALGGIYAKIAYKRTSGPCCAREINELKVASANAAIQNADISVFIAPGRNSDTFALAATEPCERSAEQNGRECDVIYITKKFRSILTENELLAILAHELGHIANPNNIPTDDIASEEFADDFSMRTMERLGKNPRALLTALDKLMDTVEPYAPDLVVYNQPRLVRLDRLFTERKGKAR